MPQTTLTINGRDYDIACGPGEEKHLAGLATTINGHVADLADQVGQLGEARMLLMVSLVLADQMHDLQNELAERDGGAEKPMSQDLRDDLAKRVEKIADRLEKA